MPRSGMSRVTVITSILIALVAIAVNANWGIGPGPFAGSERVSVPMRTDMPSPWLGETEGSLSLLPPTLGTYANTSVVLGANTAITPSATPTDTTSISVSTNYTNFKGKLVANTTTGVVRVTNAHPAGIYPITVKAFGPAGTATQTFNLMVTDGTACAGTFGISFMGSVSTDLQPRSVAVGDFNNDGNQDLVAANSGSNTVSIRLGNGTGFFGGTTNEGVGVFPLAVAVGDFNNDGNQDIIASSYSASHSVVVRLGSGAGGLSGTATTSIGAGTGPVGVYVGHFNNDGIPDIATANYDSNTVSVGLGVGNGDFVIQPAVGVGSNPYSVTGGDFNGDGNQDVATANISSDNVSIRLGNGAGGLSGTTNVAVGDQPYSVAVGDFNNDGNQDIAAANFGIPSSVSIRLGNGAGGFSGTTNVAVGSGPISVAVGDFNNDGNQDFAAANYASGTVSVRVGNGLGGFSGSINVSAGNQPYSVAVGDFNNNGKLDFATATSLSNDVIVYQGICTLPTPTATSTNTPTPTATATDTPTATATETFTPTDTPTATNTPTPEAVVSGTVTYGNAIGAPSVRGVPNVLVNAAGSPPLSDTTTASGTYSLTGFGAGSYTITPSKSGGQNGSITAFDAGRIAQYLTGNTSFSAAQATVADVSGAGGVSSYDAALIGRYAAALGSPTGSSGSWIFNPASNTHLSITTDITDDYAALLMGDTSGNWGDPSPFRPAFGASLERSAMVIMPSWQTDAGKETIIPINVQGAAGKDIIAYEFDLRYDPTVIQPMKQPVDVTGTVSRGFTVVTNASEPGLLRVVVYGAMPIDENGVLLNLRFTAVGKAGSVSPLTFERIMFNEGEPSVTIADGRVELF